MPSPQKLLGLLLVVLQLDILAALAGLLLVNQGTLQHLGLSSMLWGAGGFVGTWAVATNRPGNFNIRPTPKAGGHLVLSGPYHWIRHPMYAALLLIAAGCAVALSSLLSLTLLISLFAVLLEKARLEESYLVATHPGYAGYCTRTKRFFPSVF